MPAYAIKREALGGRGCVFSYVGKETVFYWRELVEGERRYRTKLIKGASTIDEAIANCIDTYSSLQATETRPQRSRGGSAGATPPTAGFKPPLGTLTSKSNTYASQAGLAAARVVIEDEIRRFLIHEEQRLEAGLIKPSTLKQKRIILGKSFKAYLAANNIRVIGDLNLHCLDDYIIYRGEMTKMTRGKELTCINDFIRNWLVRNELIEKSIDLKKPRILKSDLTSNPAFTPRDWRLFNNYVRNTYVKEGAKHPNHNVHYFRVLFWTFTTLAKQTGARPAELRALRWRDVEVEDIGRYSKSKGEEEERLISFITIRTSKTGEQREVPSNSGSLFKRWAQYQREYCREHYPYITISKDTYVFGNPRGDMQVHTYCCYTEAWKRIREALETRYEGNRFSDKPYTIYSLRSSFIEDHISRGTNIYLLSRLAGHSIAMLQRHYDRSDVRKFADEATKINYGSTAKRRRVIDVFD